ncbi:hypothetical protein ACFLQN_00135 [Candidatus Aenigmatarchaeota archaeon]
MEYPDGFKELVNLVKKTPVPVVKGKAIWDKFCMVVLIGKGCSEAELIFLTNMLKKYIDYDYVSNTDSEDWEEEVKKFLSERLSRITDEDTQAIISDLLKKIFFVMASLRGGARFFKKKNLFKDIDKLTKTKEKTWELIEEIAEDKDVTGIKYAKAILWLHYTGRAKDFAPPTRHLKGFLNNDVGPYHEYYDDDMFFMDKAEEMDKDFSACLMDVYRAIYFYRTLKSALPRRSGLVPKKLIKFLKKKKTSIKILSNILSDMEKRERFVKDLYEFL